MTTPEDKTQAKSAEFSGKVLAADLEAGLENSAERNESLAIAKTVIAEALESSQAVEGPRRSVLLNTAAEAYAELGDIRAARQVIDGIEDGFWRETSLQKVALSAAEQGDTASAVKLASEIVRSDDKVKVLRAAAEAGDSDALAKAIEEADRIGNSINKSRAFVGLAYVAAKGGDYDTARSMIGKDEYISSDEVLSIVVRAAAERGDIEQAEAVVAEIEDVPVRVRALARLGSVSGDDKYVTQADALARSIQDREARIDSVRDVLSIIDYVNPYEAGLRAFAGDEASGPELHFLHRRAIFAAGEGRFDAAMQDVARTGDHVATDVARIAAELGDLDKALQLQGEITDNMYKGSTLRKIFSATVERGDVDNARTAASNLENPVDRAEALLSIARALALQSKAAA